LTPSIIDSFPKQVTKHSDGMGVNESFLSDYNEQLISHVQYRTKLNI
jgi:hypothetical protein